jgi:chorismate mutase/prephenate dehydratase
VASDEAGRQYGLTVLKPSIQNHAMNSTRFFAIASEALQIKEPQKCSLELTLPHKPASLHTLLGAFAELAVNVTKIESRPIPGKPFEYTFHLDLESGGQPGEILRTAVIRARPLARDLRVLGFYSTSSIGK